MRWGNPARVGICADAIQNFSEKLLCLIRAVAVQVATARSGSMKECRMQYVSFAKEWVGCWESEWGGWGFTIALLSLRKCNDALLVG